MEKYKEQAKRYFEKDPEMKYMYVSDSGHFFYEEVDALYFLKQSNEKLHKIVKEVEPVKEVEIEVQKPKKTKK